MAEQDEKSGDPSGSRPDANEVVEEGETGRKHNVTGLPDTKLHGNRLSQGSYETAWLLYRDQGVRAPADMAKRTSLSTEVCRKLVTTGYPARGWRSFTERIVEWEREQDSAAAKARADDLLKQQDEFRRARDENLNLSRAAKVGIAQTVRKLVDATKMASVTRTRRVKQPDGSYAEIEVPPSIFDVAGAWRTIAQAVARIGVHDSLWLGGPTERTELTSKVVGVGDEVSDAHMRYIIEHRGELPPGVTDEMLFGSSKPADADEIN